MLYVTYKDGTITSYDLDALDPFVLIKQTRNYIENIEAVESLEFSVRVPEVSHDVEEILKEFGVTPKSTKNGFILEVVTTPDNLSRDIMSVFAGVLVSDKLQSLEEIQYVKVTGATDVAMQLQYEIREFDMGPRSKLLEVIAKQNYGNASPDNRRLALDQLCNMSRRQREEVLAVAYKQVTGKEYPAKTQDKKNKVVLEVPKMASIESVTTNLIWKLDL